MSYSRLQLYNDALLLVGERALSSLTESVETRRLLDQVWTNNGVRKCLEMGQWFFAMRTIQIDYDTAIEPTYGYARAFTKPTDWVITTAVCQDEFFAVPLTQYTDEAGYWYSDLDTIYVRYVSDDANYGGNLSGWPTSFQEFVAAHFASRVVLKISNDEKRVGMVLALRERLLRTAKSRAAMALPTRFAAQGGWTSARTGGGGRGDRGNNSGDLTE